MNTRVGVIVANYNQSRFFEECFNGLLSQTSRVDVICIIDDASTDNSWQQIIQVCNNYSQFPLNEKKDQILFNLSLRKDSTDIVLLKLPQNKGVSFARNKGLYALEQMKCQIMAINDMDDVYYPKKIERALDIFKKYPNVGLVCSDYDTKSPDGSIRREYKEPFSYSRLFEECIIGSDSIYALDLAKSVGNYDPKIKYGEDYDLWLRMSELAVLYHIPESLYLYRLHGENVSMKTKPEEFSSHVNYVRQKAIQRRQGNSGATTNG